MKWIKRAAPHLTIVLGLMTLTFFVIDRFNTAMAFMTSELSKWVFMLLAIFAIFSSVLLVGFHWRDDARESRRRQRARERAARSRSAGDELFSDEPDDLGDAEA